jgi:hypothetical protein
MNIYLMHAAGHVYLRFIFASVQFGLMLGIVRLRSGYGTCVDK